MPSAYDQWALDDWQFNRQREQAVGQSPWYDYGFDPMNPWGQTYAGPGGEKFQVTPEMQDAAAYSRYRENPFSQWISPGRYMDVNFTNNLGDQAVGLRQGHLTINPSAMMRAFGLDQQGAGAGAGAGEAPEWGYQTPGEWGGYDFTTQVVDPSQVISSMEPYFQEQRERGFAEAAARMGPSMRGAVASTPYAEALGGVARRSTEDLARIAAEYQYKAAEQAAQRDLQRNLAQQAADLSAWQTHGGWQHGGGLAEQGYGLDRWGMQQNYDLQQQMMQQQQQQQYMDMIAQMMGGMFGGLF